MAQEKEDTTKTSQIGVTVEKGKTVTINDVSIKFVQVLEDSRCPKYVDCFWPGQAKIEVMVTEKGKDPVTQEITLGATPSASKNTTFYKKDNTLVELLALNPYPEDGKEMGTYTLLISKGAH